MNSFKEFFWKCAGVHRDTLVRYPEEHSKYVSIGATVFFTGLFAALAGGYAMYFVFSGTDYAILLSLIFGIIWGLAIFNLDRYIVLSIDKTKGGWKQFLQALPRILLAILIGLVISRPLELKIFDKEIREHLRKEYLIKQQAAIDTLNSTFEHKYGLEYTQLNNLRAEADSLDSYIKHARQQLNHEIFGTKTAETSGKMGFGPYAKMKDEQLKKQEIQLDTIRAHIFSKETELSKRKLSEGIMDQQILTDSKLDSAIQIAGFADRNAALSNLHKKHDGTTETSTQYAVIFITALFVFFECLPVLVKLMSGTDTYDIAIAHQRTIHNFESASDVDVEKNALNQLVPERTEAAIQRRRDQLHNKFINPID